MDETGGLEMNFSTPIVVIPEEDWADAMSAVVVTQVPPTPTSDVNQPSTDAT
jgi:hypothetical protein